MWRATTPTVAGGTKASDYAEEHVFPNFKEVFDRTKDVNEAMVQSFAKTDVDYIKQGREDQDPSMLLTGTCAVAIFRAHTSPRARLPS